jgi:diguanylate cyclase (GGDEF)-like protein
LLILIPYYILLVAVLLVAVWYRKTVTSEREEWTLRLENSEYGNRILTERLNELSAAERDIRAKETAIVGLYEVTKEMSAHLKFNEIFRVFSVFLKNNFSFKRCELIVIEKDESGLSHIGKVYGIWKEDPMLGSERAVDYDKMLRYFSDYPERVYIGGAGALVNFENVGISDSSTRSFLGTPLFVSGKPVAMLTIENLAEDELEKFGILAIQFSLEINKVSLYETVEKMAITDSLTGLYVRRYFSDRLEEELGRSARQGLKFSFIMIDIDDFKKANDTYGHLVGDVILKDVGRIIRESIREIDLACRYGGEEFAAVLPETSKEGAFVVAERIRKHAEDSVFKAYDERVKITLSIGVSTYPDDSANQPGLIEAADEALYNAKKSGKNVVCKHDK